VSNPSPADVLTTSELAALGGTSVEHVTDLADRGVLHPVATDTFGAGDVHRLRILAAFDDAGVTVDALLEAARLGTVDFAYYDGWHQPPGRPADRTFDAFRASLGEHGDQLGGLFTAFGLAAPNEDSRLSTDDERSLTELLEMMAGTGRPDLVIRLVRVFGETARRASEASMSIYAEASAALDAELGERQLEVDYERLFVPWSRLARAVPGLAAWLVSKHLSRAIDAYSVDVTDAMLTTAGLLPERPGVPPAIAFVDLSGFTRLTEERGDEVAARTALRLGDLAMETAARHRGRVVKLLGDGVLIWFEDALSGVDGVLDLLDALPAAGLPAGHGGVHHGPLIARDGDVFGRTVNLAARIGDAAPVGALYVTEAVAAALAQTSHDVQPVGTERLQGLGEVALFRVSRGGSRF
jgi:class 3 adenylate cyclase